MRCAPSHARDSCYAIAKLRICNLLWSENYAPNARVANQTNAQRIAELEADRTRIRTALAAAQSAASTSGFTLGDMSVQSGVGINIKYLRDELNQVEKSLQRMYRGGRGMQVDVSGAAAASGDGTVIHSVCGLPL